LDLADNAIEEGQKRNAASGKKTMELLVDEDVESNAETFIWNKSLGFFLIKTLSSVLKCSLKFKKKLFPLFRRQPLCGVQST
jgi:hypothetical protein